MLRAVEQSSSARSTSTSSCTRAICASNHPTRSDGTILDVHGQRLGEVDKKLLGKFPRTALISSLAIL